MNEGLIISNMSIRTEDTVKILKIESKDAVVLFKAPHGNWYVSGIRL